MHPTSVLRMGLCLTHWWPEPFCGKRCAHLPAEGVLLFSAHAAAEHTQLLVLTGDPVLLGEETGTSSLSPPLGGSAVAWQQGSCGEHRHVSRLIASELGG